VSGDTCDRSTSLPIRCISRQRPPNPVSPPPALVGGQSPSLRWRCGSGSCTAPGASSIRRRRADPAIAGRPRPQQRGHPAGGEDVLSRRPRSARAPELSWVTRDLRGPRSTARARPRTRRLGHRPARRRTRTALDTAAASLGRSVCMPPDGASRSNDHLATSSPSCRARSRSAHGRSVVPAISKPPDHVPRPEVEVGELRSAHLASLRSWHLCAAGPPLRVKSPNAGIHAVEMAYDSTLGGWGDVRRVG